MISPSAPRNLILQVYINLKFVSNGYMVPRIVHAVGVTIDLYFESRGITMSETEYKELICKLIMSVNDLAILALIYNLIVSIKKKKGV